MIAFAAFNLALYARPLGRISFSTLDPLPFFEHLKTQSLPALPEMLHDLVHFVPLTLAVVIGSGLLSARRSLSDTSLRLLVVLLIFVLGVPVIVIHAGRASAGAALLLSAHSVHLYLGCNVDRRDSSGQPLAIARESPRSDGASRRHDTFGRMG